MFKIKTFYQLFCVLASLVCIKAGNAAEITKEFGENGLADVIRISGQFNLGDQDKFQAVALTSKKAIVFLDSPGGKVSAATEIGTIIRLKGFETAVDDAVCASACALVWLAGEPRTMSNSTSIGFHTAFTTDKDGKRTSSVSDGAIIGAYLTRMGFNERVVSYVTSASADDMNWLNKSTAEQLGISVALTTELTKTKSLDLFAEGLKLANSNPRFPFEASKNYRQSADIGFAGAQNNLGDMYEKGEGLTKSDKAAVYWYTRAAERGEPTAYLSLAHILSEGTADVDLLVESAKYAALAFAMLPEGKNKKSAEKLLIQLSQRLSQTDKDRMLELTIRWMPLYQEKYLMGDSPRN